MIQDLKETKNIARFLSKIQIAESGCWEWQGVVSEGGYGMFTISFKDVRHTGVAHRFSYELFNEVKLPKTRHWELDHLCRNKICVNPTHLEWVSHRDNIMRTLPFRQDFAPNGCTHNILISKSRCVLCQREYQRQYWRRVRSPGCRTRI